MIDVMLSLIFKFKLRNKRELHRYENESKFFDHLTKFDSESFFTNVFYPLLNKIDERELISIAESLNDTEREVLLSLPKVLTNQLIIDAYSLDENSHMELVCFSRIIKSYKHEKFFDLLYLINVDKKYDLGRENHKFGYHFHLYIKKNRTATLLTFNKNEKPNKMSDKDYGTFAHKVYYEPHAEGRNDKGFENLNDKGKNLKFNLYKKCRDQLNVINKIDFKMPSKRKSMILELN